MPVDEILKNADIPSSRHSKRMDPTKQTCRKSNGGKAARKQLNSKFARAMDRMCGRPSLWTASREGRTVTVRQLLAEEEDVEERGGPRGSSPLCEAALNGHEDVVVVLLEHGADVSALDTEGRHCLHFAALQGYEAVVILLIEHAADVSALDKEGRAPLHLAASCGHAAASTLLIEHVADVSAQDNSGCSPLHLAANFGHNGHAAVIQLLLDKGAEVSAQNHAGEMPIHSAALHGYEAIVTPLIDHGADLSAADHSGRAPLHLAAKGGHEAVIQILLDKGADHQSKTNTGRTPEGVASACSQPQAAAMLKSHREEVRKIRCVAFAMGHQERLGAGSRVRGLDPGVVQMVMENV